MKLIPKFESVAIGVNCAMFIDKDGKIWGMGENGENECKRLGLDVSEVPEQIKPC